MERLFFRERGDRGLSGMDEGLEWNLKEPEKQKKIAVVGISRGAGATFIATTLAFLLRPSKFAEPCRIAYVECRQPKPGEPLVFYGAGLDRAFGSRFTDFFSPVYQGRRPANIHKGISWVVHRHCSRDVSDLAGKLSEPDRIRPDTGRSAGAGFPANLPPFRYLVADSPDLDTLHQYDLVLAVMDPLPAAVYAGAETYEAIRDLAAGGMPVMWILNKDCAEVNHSALKRFLKLKEYISVPPMEQDLLAKAQYTCQLPAELLAGEQKQCLEELARKVTEQLEQKNR